LLAAPGWFHHLDQVRILVVPDKFKGTLTAQAAARAIASGWRSVRRTDQIRLLPMSDGGDGFGEVLGKTTGAGVRKVKTVDAAGRPCVVPWWFDAGNRLAIIESARVIGLAMLPKGRFHPFDLDTRGLGAVIDAAIRAGASRCLIGIGGSATNDGGFGLARALGWEFCDRNHRAIETWSDLHRAVEIIPPDRSRRFRSCVVAVDVQNPLLGRRGATRVYGPQKGIAAEDFLKAETALSRLAKLVEASSGRNIAAEAGAGAAGGLGFGLSAFLGGRLRPGFNLFAQEARLQQHLRWADLVITGEGQIDASTLMGKGVGQITRICSQRGISCLGLAGNLRLPASPAGVGFAFTLGITDITTNHEAITLSAWWLRQLAAKAAKMFV